MARPWAKGVMSSSQNASPHPPVGQPQTKKKDSLVYSSAVSSLCLHIGERKFNGRAGGIYDHFHFVFSGKYMAQLPLVVHRRKSKKSLRTHLCRRGCRIECWRRCTRRSGTWGSPPRRNLCCHGRNSWLSSSPGTCRLHVQQLRVRKRWDGYFSINSNKRIKEFVVFHPANPSCKPNFSFSYPMIYTTTYT